MASEASFDVVSKVDHQEVDNALNQAAKEIAQRYDFKGVGASIEWSGHDAVLMVANSPDRVPAILDVFETKLIKRGISLKAHVVTVAERLWHDRGEAVESPVFAQMDGAARSHRKVLRCQ